jgi:hypothetical protein
MGDPEEVRTRYNIVCLDCGNNGFLKTSTADWTNWKYQWEGFKGESSQYGPKLGTVRCLKCRKRNIEMTRQANATSD